MDTGLMPSTWIYTPYCVDRSVTISGADIEFRPSEKEFIKKEEDFGELYYSRAPGPIFKNCYLRRLHEVNHLQLRAPVRVDIELTSKCLLKCRHCYFGSKGNQDLPLSVIQKLLDDLRIMGTIGVQLVGGEPFLYPNIANVVGMAKERGLKVEIFTSGFGASEEALQSVKGQVDFISIDIDGVRETHDAFRGRKGSFEAALRLFEVFAGSGTHVDVTMILHKENISEIEEVHSIASANGASSFNVRLFHPSGEGRYSQDIYLSENDVGDEVNKRIEALNKNSSLAVRPPYRFNVSNASVAFFGCPGGVFTITVKPDGSITKCNVNRKILGNICTRTFNKVWEDICRDRVVQKQQTCGGNCDFSGYCGGLCELEGLDKSYCFSLATK